jgi:hypothetical protein
MIVIISIRHGGDQDAGQDGVPAIAVMDRTPLDRERSAADQQ